LRENRFEKAEQRSHFVRPSMANITLIRFQIPTTNRGFEIRPSVNGDPRGAHGRKRDALIPRDMWKDGLMLDDVTTITELKNDR
jgi:hypothetical protein